MTQLVLLKVGEISLKGGNRQFFDKKLIRNIKQKLKSLQIAILGKHRRFYIECRTDDIEMIESALSETFGLVGYARAYRVEKDYDQLELAVRAVCQDFLSQKGNATFKISARRTDKSFPLRSYEIAVKLGDFVRKEFSGFKVDVKCPDLVVSVEVRDLIYVYGNTKPGPGGLPVGTAGRGTLLLSGGIDSPVAGYLMAKRGLRLDAVYFHAYPYTSEQAKEKVRAIAGKLSAFFCGVDLFTVPFTEIALHIKSHAPEDQMTLLMRACMMDIACRLIEKRSGLCLVTGESLSQVASQTPESMRFTESTSNLPVFRPLIGLDKEEIITIARSIGTYELSILPHQDCCVVFAPERPLIKPKYSLMRLSLEKLEIEGALQLACENAEIVRIRPVSKE